MRRIFTILFILCFYSGIALAQHEGLSYYVEGENLRRSAQYEKAIVEFNRALQREPNNHKYLYARAQCEQKLKKNDAALASLTTAVKLRNDYVPAYLLLAEIHKGNNDINKAAEYYDIAFKYEADLDKKVSYKFFVVNKLLKEDNNKEAYTKIKEAKEVAPHDETVTYYYAKISNSIGHYEEAKKSLLSIENKFKIQKQEEAAKYYFELGYAYYHLHDYLKANEYWSKAEHGVFKARIEKFMPKYFCAVALAYFKFHENALSKSYVDKAIKVQEDYPLAHVLLAQLSKRNTNHTSAISHYVNAAGHETDSKKKLLIYDKIADMQLQSGDYTNCLNTVTQSLRIKSDDADALFTRCLALHKMGNHRGAVEAINEILKAPLEAGMKAQFNFLLGLAYKKMGDKKQARIAFVAASASSLHDAAELELGNL